MRYTIKRPPMKQNYTDYFSPSEAVLSYIRFFAYNYDNIPVATRSRLFASES